MNIKIDTKERFTVFTPQQKEITVNMAEDFDNTFKEQLTKNLPHLVLNMETVEKIDADIAQLIAEAQQMYYEKNYSFVICCLQDKVEECFEKIELLDFLNTTPTESEAWDIVQMEEIERELLDGE